MREIGITLEDRDDEVSVSLYNGSLISVNVRAFWDEKAERLKMAIDFYEEGTKRGELVYDGDELRKQEIDPSFNLDSVIHSGNCTAGNDKGGSSPGVDISTTNHSETKTRPRDS